jgi:hypothetical protein
LIARLLCCSTVLISALVLFACKGSASRPDAGRGEAAKIVFDTCVRASFKGSEVVLMCSVGSASPGQTAPIAVAYAGVSYDLSGPPQEMLASISARADFKAEFPKATTQATQVGGKPAWLLRGSRAPTARQGDTFYLASETAGGKATNIASCSATAPEANDRCLELLPALLSSGFPRDLPAISTPQ